MPHLCFRICFSLFVRSRWRSPPSQFFFTFFFFSETRSVRASPSVRRPPPQAIVFFFSFFFILILGFTHPRFLPLNKQSFFSAVTPLFFCEYPPRVFAPRLFSFRFPPSPSPPHGNRSFFPCLSLVFTLQPRGVFFLSL